MTALYFDARIDGAQLQKDVAYIKNQISGISKHAAKEGQQIDAISRRIGTALAGAFSIYTGTRFIKDIARVRGEFQQLEVAFETMLGSKAKADKLMAEVVEFAQTTPFELTEVAAGTKQLLAYGTASEDIIPTLKSLGDVSAGLSVPIERLILNYGQVRTQLKLTGRELRDFNVAGVPIVAELAKNLDVTEQKIQDMVTNGEIGFTDVEKAFRTMTEEGGRFNNLMDKQSKTITGLASNFQDAWDKMLNSIGEQNQGIIADVIKGAINVTEHYEEVIKILKILVVTYGTYKAAVIATAVAQKASAAAGAVQAWFQLAKGIKTAKDAQIAFNLATKANPIGLIAAGVATLVTVLTLYGKKAKEISGISQEFTGNLSREKKAIDELFDTAKNTDKTYNQRITAIRQINSRYGEYLDNLLSEKTSLEEIEEAQKNVNHAIAQNLAAKSMEGQISEIRKNVADQEKSLSEAFQRVVESLKLTPEQQGVLSASIEKSLLDPENMKEKLKETLDGFGSEVDKFDKRLENLKRGSVGTLSLEISKVVDARNKERDAINDTKNAYDAYLEALGLKGGKNEEPTVLKTINERIEETKTKLDEAKRKLDELRSGDSTASAKDIEDQEKKIKELLNTLETLTGVSKKVKDQIEKTAKERFEALQDYAEKEIELERTLQASKIAIMKQGADRQKAEAELAYQGEIDRIRQQQQAYLEAYNAKLGFEPTDEGYITELPADALAKFDQLRIDAENAKAQRIKEINRKTADEIKDIQGEVNEAFLSDIEKEIKAINEKYDNLIKRAKEAGETNFNQINKARNKEIDEAYIDSGIKRLEFEEDIELQRAEISTQGFNREEETEKKKLEIAIKYAQLKIDLLKKSGKEESNQEIQNLELFIESAGKGVEALKTKNKFEDIYQYASSIGSEIEDWGDSFKAISDVLSGISGDINTINKALDGTLSKEGAIAAAAEKVVQLVDIVVTSSKQRKEAEKRYYDSVLEQQRQYNLLLNEQLRLEYELTSNIFTTDYKAQITSGIESFTDAIEQYQSAIAGLADGRVITGQRNAIDWDKMLSGGVGGGIVGGLIGIFGGKKKEDVYGDLLSEYPELVKQAANGQQQLNIALAETLISQKLVNDETAAALQNAIDWNKQMEQAQSQFENAIGTLSGNLGDNLRNALVEAFRSGENAGKIFAQNVSNTLENALSQILFAQVFGGIFDNLQKDMIASFSPTGDQNWIDDFGKFFEQGTDALKVWERGLNELSEAGKKYGFDLFSGVNSSSQQGLTGAIRGITEETAGLIAGQFTAMREYQTKSYFTAVEQLDAINQSVTHLEKIEQNTRYNKNLEQIRTDISEMNAKIQKDL